MRFLLVHFRSFSFMYILIHKTDPNDCYKNLTGLVLKFNWLIQWSSHSGQVFWKWIVNNSHFYLFLTQSCFFTSEHFEHTQVLRITYVIHLWIFLCILLLHLLSYVNMRAIISSWANKPSKEAKNFLLHQKAKQTTVKQFCNLIIFSVKNIHTRVHKRDVGPQ